LTLSAVRGRVRGAAGRAGLTMETPAASLPSEVEVPTGAHVRPEFGKFMQAGPLRDGKLMASERYL